VARKFKVGILGATGMVGQRFITLLENHSQIEVVAVAASARSAGKTYGEAIQGRLKPGMDISQRVMNLPVDDVLRVGEISEQVDFVFSALDMPREEIRELEDAYAKTETVVVSNNSAHRWTPDVPMIIPEVNPDHLGLIANQRRRLGTSRGCVVVKPNCSLQSFLPPLFALLPHVKVKAVTVTTFQAVSGAGKTIADWPEMEDNVIPYIGGEEAKTSEEPLKILASINGLSSGMVLSEAELDIYSTCVRVPISNGHLAVVNVECKTAPNKELVQKIFAEFNPLPQQLKLESAPTPCIVYDDANDRPQTRLDRDNGRGMAFTVGRYESYGNRFRFVALSHNTIRGAAGGAILTAELMIAQEYIKQK